MLDRSTVNKLCDSRTFVNLLEAYTRDICEKIIVETNIYKYVVNFMNFYEFYEF